MQHHLTAWTAVSTGSKSVYPPQLRGQILLNKNCSKRIFLVSTESATAVELFWFVHTQIGKYHCTKKKTQKKDILGQHFYSLNSRVSAFAGFFLQTLVSSFVAGSIYAFHNHMASDEYSLNPALILSSTAGFLTKYLLQRWKECDNNNNGNKQQS